MFRQHRNDMRRFLELTGDLQQSRIGSAAFYTLDRIDQKTGTLLTHVSIMTGMTALLYTRLVAIPVIQWALQIELLIYLSITLGCLYAIAMAKPGAQPADLDSETASGLNLVFRRLTAYRFCLFATLLNTLSFMITFIAESHLRL